MKNAVVTGGAGFIGSHLAEELTIQGYNVLIIDDLSTGRIENIESLLTRDNAEFIQGSITNLSLLRQHFRKINYVFHQAAIPSVPRSIDTPRAAHNVNITGTLNVLLAAKDSGVSKVIYASSSSIYGDTPKLPKTEDMTPNPQSPYAVTKLTGEYYCQVFHRVYSLPTICLRYFNIYGPKQNPESQYAAVIPSFIKKISENKPPVIFGDGEQSRDFTFVKDAVRANILAAESNASGIFNISRGESITINQLAQLIISIIGKNNIKPTYANPRPGDIKHSIADISKARTFGYKPEYNLERGLKETIMSFQHEA